MELKSLDNELEKESDLVICVSGPSGAGKDTLTDQISRNYGLKNISAGKFFRKKAEKQGLSVEEFSEKADEEADQEIDEKVAKKALKTGSVVGSRIAPWILGELADVKIFIKADLDERSRRVAERENLGKKEARSKVERRDLNDRKRYREYYGIDVQDLSIFDMVLDNTDLGIEGQKRIVETFLDHKIE